MSDVERTVWEKEEANWRFVQTKDRDAYVGLWDDRFVGWPKLEPEPIHKNTSFGCLEGRRLLDYQLEPVSVREYGDSVVITFHPARTESVHDLVGSQSNTRGEWHLAAILHRTRFVTPSEDK